MLLSISLLVLRLEQSRLTQSSFRHRIQDVTVTSGLAPGHACIEKLRDSASQTFCAHRFPKELVKMQILIPQFWGRAWEAAFPTSIRVMLKLLVPGPLGLAEPWFLNLTQGEESSPWSARRLV